MSAHNTRLHRFHWAFIRAVKRLEVLLGGETTILIALGALTGVAAGFGAVLFVTLVHAVSSVVWEGSLALHDVAPAEVLVDVGPWRLAAIVPVGILVAAWLARRFAPDAAGHGVPEVMASVAERSGRMRARSGWVKMISSAINIGMGGSVGKEGPIVQVGSAFGSTIGRFFALRGSSLRTLVGCGAAAGIAAVFNAPIGGVMFAAEIIIGGFQLSAFSPVVIASVAGSITARRFLDATPMFAIPESLKQGLTIQSPWEMLAYVGLGLVCGAVSVGFIRTLYAIEDGAERWRAPWWFKAIVAGLLVAAAGWWFPDVLGEGHHAMSSVLIADVAEKPWTLLLALIAVKMVATSVTIGGGGSGGVFAPSLFVGAMLGGAFGQGLDALFPGQVGGFGGYAVVGMAAMLAGTAHAPLTGILLLFEMTDNYLLMLPLMTSAVISTVVAVRMMPVSIYTLKLARRGIVLQGPRDVTILRRLRVGDVMQPATETIHATTPFHAVAQRLLQSDMHDYPVVDDEGRLVGALSLDDVREFLREEGPLGQLLLARECVHPIRTLRKHDTLFEALEAFDRANAYELPVVEDGTAHARLVGSLRRRDVMSRYREALLADLQQRGAA